MTKYKIDKKIQDHGMTQVYSYHVYKTVWTSRHRFRT